MRDRVATDIGGTFTDFVALEEGTGRLTLTKVSSTPDAPERAVRECVEKVEHDLSNTQYLIHGTTIAINTLLELKGAKTALLTTKGFRDVYEIGRANRLDMYDCLYNKPKPLVPRELRFEVTERVRSSGDILEPLDRDEAASVLKKLKDLGVESLAVCLINAYVNPVHEKELGELARKICPDIPVTLSHEVLREYREYERTSTTCVNAYVAPRVTKYVRELEGEIRRKDFRGSLLIMQSNGGVMSPELATQKPVTLMESGPAGGVVGAIGIGELLGYNNVISFDMGGTTAKACLVEDGRAKVTNQYRVGGKKGHPIVMPVTDLVEVGAGGGSLAWIDDAGALMVGPRSAGSDPGPACYGWGGHEPTVTDANLLTGRLNPKNFLGGEMPLDPEAAEKAILRVATRFDFTSSEMALGILKIVNTNMLHGLRAVTIERGYDPRDFVLVAFGGAGPVHATALARELEIPKVIVPLYPGNFSAFAMLLTDLKHDYVQTLAVDFAVADPSEVERVFASMEAEGKEHLTAEGVTDKSISVLRFLDMRYVGQEHSVSVPISAEKFREDIRLQIKESFDKLHQTHYGVSEPGSPAQIVNLRVTVVGKVERPEFQKLEAGKKTVHREAIAGSRKVLLVEGADWTECPIYFRSELRAGNRFTGPAIVEEYASTTVLHEGDEATVTEHGHIVIEIGA